MPLKEDYVYLSGLIDGDGCFSIGRNRNTFVPRILIVNTNYNIMLWLKDTFGGDVNKSTVKYKPKWKPRYTWRLSHKKALILADNIYPFLKIKHKQALVFKVWLASQDVFKPMERKEGYEYLSNRISFLNKRGVDNAFTQN